MSDLLAARGQMSVSLAFHILFAVAGMAMPVLMLIAELRHLRGGDPLDRALAQRWAKGTAILFAVGAVSGTVLSFELGMLWPRFMALAGPVVGLPFALEGYAFFLEAIFLGLYLYGRDRLSPKAHLACALMVALSGLASGVFVMAVNAWMHTPTGFAMAPDGSLLVLDAWAAFRAASFPTQAAHMALASYASVSGLALGIHALGLLRHRTSRFHARGATIALVMFVISTPLQILSGDLSAKHLTTEQPLKLAAAEGLFHTTRGAPLAIGGWPDLDEGKLVGAIHIPKLLSVLATGDPDGEVRGLHDFPRDEWPPVAVAHVAFQVMVGAGSAMMLMALWGGFVLLAARRRGAPLPPSFLRAAVLASPLGLIALEAGWTLTEVGRQPWIIRGVLRTADAVTPVEGLAVPFVMFTLLYVILGVVVVVMLRAHVFQASAEEH